MIEILGAIAGSGIFSSVLGFLGSILSRWFAIHESADRRKTIKMEQEHEILLLQMQARIQAEELESEAAIAEIGERQSALMSSYRHDSQYNGSWMAMVRPFLTTLFIILCMVIYILADPSTDTRTQVVHQIINLTGVSVGWWFADRARK